MRLLWSCAASALIVASTGAYAQAPGNEGAVAPSASGIEGLDSLGAVENEGAPQPALDSVFLDEPASSGEEVAPVEPAPVPAGTPIDRILDTQGGSRALSQQNVDPNSDLLRVLQSARREGAVLRVSPETVFLDFEEGNTGSASIRINNLGDSTATIRGINAVAPIEDLLVTTGCGDTLEPGAFCDIAVSFSSNTPREIFTAIVIGVDEGDRSSIEVPVRINVQPAADTDPVVIQPVTPPVSQVQISPNDPRLAPPPPPTAEDIARAYYGAVGGIEGPSTGSMSVISIPDALRRPEKPYIETLGDSLSVETISQDPRYPDDVASTQATLPVDRSNIITADRVIKAVLDTPFSNVMCGKVVAVIESDVYSATSHRALIPSGSRAIGRCGQLVKERAGIVWERIITTDGRSISLAGEDSMTRDASGLGGALGRVYRTPYDRYVLPIFGTFVDVGAGFVKAIYGEDEEQSVTDEGTVVQGTSARNEGIQTATDAIQNTSQQIIQEMADVREVMVVPAGTRIDIEIFEDIYFKDERQIVRLGDTVYDVARQEAAQAAITQPYNIALEPYRPGAQGAVVMVNGQRYVVREGEALAAIPQDGAAAASPQQNVPVPQGNGRPTASSPTASTSDTLNDLNSSAR